MKKILVPLDGSAFAEQATDTARAIAARTGAALEFIVVHELALPPSRVGGAPVLDPRLDTEMRASRHRYLDRIEKAERERGTVKVSGTFREGRAAEQIASFASETAANLIVMTTHGRGGFERLWLGSVADGVVRGTSVPVLLVRPEFGSAAGGGVELNQVIVAVSGSDQDDPLISAVLELTDPLRSQYTLIHVLSPAPTLIPIDPDLGIAPVDVAAVPAEVDDRRESDAAAYLQLMARPFREHTVAVDTRVTHAGNAARAVVSLAEEKKANLIAVGTAARRPASRFFMGSVADKVVRRAHASVLVVPSRPSD